MKVLLCLAILAMVFLCAQAENSMITYDKYGSISCGGYLCDTGCCTQIDDFVYCEDYCVSASKYNYY